MKNTKQHVTIDNKVTLDNIFIGNISKTEILNLRAMYHINARQLNIVKNTCIPVIKYGLQNIRIDIYSVITNKTKKHMKIL